MKPLTVLGQSFATEADFQRAFPAYQQYIAIVRAGADTPLKVEMALYSKQKGQKDRRAPRYGKPTRPRKRA